MFSKFYNFATSMDILSIIGIAIALSFDSFAAAISCGLNCKPLTWNHKLFIPFSFGIFQAGMPLIGYFAGYNLLQYINAWDHWLAFGLLFLIGIHMIREALSKEDSTRHFRVGWKVIISMSFATSIDALATGFSFGLLMVNIWLAVAIIFIITFAASVFGMMTGNNFRTPVMKKWSTIAGGIILIGIGLKVAFTHMLDHGLLS